MKKKLFLFATAALVLAGCNNDVTIDENTALVGSNAQKEIAFTPYAKTPKRAAGSAEYNVVAGTTYPQNYNMKVVAYVVPETGDAGNYFGSATADGGVLFSYQFAGGESTPAANANYWGGNPAQYWPLAPATLNFLAVSKGGSPTADVVAPLFNANYASGATITLSDNTPQTANSGAVLTAQHDLMYGIGRATVTQAGNLLSFPDKVDMTFQHALAWVDFQVKGNTTVEQSKITLNSITLHNARYAGKYEVNVTNYDKAAGAGDLEYGTCRWLDAGIGAQVANQVVPGYTTPTTLPADYTSIGKGLLVIPTGSKQTTGVSFDSFTLNYTINGATFDYTYTPEAAQKTLLMDKKYIFKINFTLHEIYVNAIVEAWDTPAEEVDVEIPETITYAVTTATHTLNIPAAAGTYYVRVTDLVATPTVNTTTDIFSVDPAKSSFAGGTAVITFTVDANDTGTEKTGVFTVTDGTKTTTITVNQAH